MPYDEKKRDRFDPESERRLQPQLKLDRFDCIFHACGSFMDSSAVRSRCGLCCSLVFPASQGKEAGQAKVIITGSRLRALFIFILFSLIWGAPLLQAVELFEREQELLQQVHNGDPGTVWELAGLYRDAGCSDEAALLFLDGSVLARHQLSHTDDAAECELCRQAQALIEGRRLSASMDAVLKRVKSEFLWQEAPSKALKLLSDIPESYDRPAELIYLRASALFEQHAYRRSAALFRQLTQLYPAVELRFNAAFQAERAEKAILGWSLRVLYAVLIILTAVLLLLIPLIVLSFRRLEPQQGLRESLHRGIIFLAGSAALWTLFFVSLYFVTDGFYNEVEGVPIDTRELPVFVYSGMNAVGSLNSWRIYLSILGWLPLPAFCFASAGFYFRRSAFQALYSFISIFLIFLLLFLRLYFFGVEKSAVIEQGQLRYRMHDPELFLLYEPRRFRYLESSRVEDPEMIDWFVRRLEEMPQEQVHE